jgi:hypothetical protein
MSTSSNDAETIQREMRLVREELRADVREVVSNTQDLMDAARVLTQWQTYVRNYPWACLGAAAAVGFFVVPSRPKVIKPDTESLMELARSKKLVFQVDPPAAKQPGMMKSLLGMAAGTAMQLGMGIVSKQLNQFIASAAQAPPTRREGAYHD